MQIRSKQIYNFILFWLVLLPIYQDSPLSLFLGAAGYTFVMPLSLILIVIYVLLISRVPKNEYLHGLVKLGIGMTVVSFVAIIVWCALGNPITIVSEILPIKALKVCLQYFSYPAYIALLIIVCRKVGTENIGKYSFITLLLLTVICFIEVRQLPYAFEGFHFAGTFPYWRVRLLSTESSWTAMMIYVYAFLSLFWTFRNNIKLLSTIDIICCAYLFWTTGSRTLMMLPAITVVVYVIFTFRKLSRNSIVMLIIAFLAMVAFIQYYLPQLSSSFQVDIENYTSLATRFYTCLLGFFIGIIFPAGVGGAVYLGVFQAALSDYMWIFDRLPISLNTSEIVNLSRTASDVSLTVKSGIFHYNMYWGIVGTIYLFKNFIMISEKISRYDIKYVDMLLTAFWTAIILLIFTSNFSFEFWLLFAFIICMEEEVNRSRAAKCK